MNSSTTKSFRSELEKRPSSVRELALKSYRLWAENPRHPSLHFKPIGPYFSIRIGLHYRALGREKDGCLYWFWIGHHKAYDRMIKDI